MKHTLTKSLALAAGAGFLAASQAEAVLCYDVNTQGTYLGNFAGNTPGPGDPDYIYKSNRISESYPSAGDADGADFETTYSNGGLTATIDLKGASGEDFTFFFMKAGNEYVKWDISNMTSLYDCITVTNDGLITNRQEVSQALSHVEIHGKETNDVPEGGASVALLGLGLAGLGATRRFLGKKA